MLQTEPRTRQDSLRLAAFRRADSAAALVDSLLVTPATLRLRVGDSLSIEQVHVDARDRTGAHVLKVAPQFSVEPRTVARLRGSYLVALAAGQATLLIKPVRLGRSPPPAPTRPLTRVPVQVVDP